MVCKPGWQFFCNSCYGIVNAAFTWFEARARCATLGAHLVAINSEQENDFIVEFMAPLENVWIGGHGSGNVHEWDGGDPWDFSAFRQPFYAQSSYQCIELFNDGTWLLFDCYSVPWAVCEAEVDTQQ